jgi:hypothetical protein
MRKGTGIEMSRIIVMGPYKFDDYTFVKETLDRLTAEELDITLVQDLRPGKEYHRTPSSFPIAEQWFRSLWRRCNRELCFDKRFSITVRYESPGEGGKQWSKGLKEQKLNMVKNADRLIVFWDVGNVDEDLEELVKLAELYDLKIDRVLI